MNRLKPILFVIVLVLIGAAAGVLAHAKSSQKLGSPGVKTRPLAGSYNLEVLLPADVPGYQSRAVPIADVVTNMLPADTSFGQRTYRADDGFQCLVNVVLMGSSRASIHKPQICLTAQGWNINDELSRVDRVHLDRPVPYDLPLMHLIASGHVTTTDGQKLAAQGVYLYWFVDADRLTASHAQRMLWSARDVVTTGVLDRWAYVSLFSVCPAGQENATFDRMKKLVAAAVPDFQLVPSPPK
jgi:hypothetical protein